MELRRGGTMKNKDRKAEGREAKWDKEGDARKVRWKEGTWELKEK